MSQFSTGRSPWERGLGTGGNPENPGGPPDNDIVWGAREIGRVINRSERQVFHLIELGVLPVKKLHGIYSASARRLREAVAGESA
jgi:hypothetical protein